MCNSKLLLTASCLISSAKLLASHGELCDGFIQLLKVSYCGKCLINFSLGIFQCKPSTVSNTTVKLSTSVHQVLLYLLEVQYDLFL